MVANSKGFSFIKKMNKQVDTSLDLFKTLTRSERQELGETTMD